MRQFIYVLIALFLFTTINLTNAQTAKSWTDKVDSPVLEDALRGESADFIVLLREQADVSGARLIRGKTEKGTYVYNSLQKKAQETQGRIIDMLEAENAFFQPYFLVNMIHAEGDLDLVRRLAELPEVKRIAVNPVIRADVPVEQAANPRGVTALEWGVEKINADDVWALGVKGEGVVIGGQDTGYEWFHPALQEKYRGWDGAAATHDYHWHDAIQEPINGDTNPCGYGASEPCDDHFHGTHTMGTMIGLDGDNQIGVAPDAKWIGCRNMDKGFGTPVTYIDCFEWFLAPTDLNDENADPAMAPHVINNSWSCPESEGCFPSNFEVMETAVNNLKAGGVVVVVSAGNSGSACETVNTPSAIFENSFSIGATDSEDMIAGFSSRGPVMVDGSGRLKPDVAAPGVGVRSATLGGGYSFASGTSMAGPHTAGMVALIISANPDLAGEVDTIEQIIRETAVKLTADQDCGMIPGSEVPNHTYGHGRIDALEAVNRAMSMIVANEEVEGSHSVEVFPNPFSQEIIILRKGQMEAATLDLFNGQGQLIRSVLLSSERTVLSLPDIPSGVYWYRMRTEDRVQKGTLIKQ